MEKQELDKLRAQVFGLYALTPHVNIGSEIDHWIVELRSIDSLTDEEKKPIMESELSDGDYGRWVTDYVRSLGIATKYLTHSVEELIQLGIVKLKA